MEWVVNGLKNIPIWIAIPLLIIICSFLIYALITGRSIDLWGFKIDGFSHKKDNYKKKNQSQDIETLREIIRTCLTLFRHIAQAWSPKTAKFRVHFLRFNHDNQLLEMLTQDGIYEDSDFRIDIESGAKKGIIVCKAAKLGKFIYEELSTNHYVKYSDSSIPEKLHSVMAFPIIIDVSTLIGVLSLDSNQPFSSIGIDEEQLKNIFIELGQTIKKIIQLKE